MARYTGPNQELPVNSVKESLEQIKFYLRRIILPDNMVTTEEERLLSMVSCWQKNKS